LVITGASVVSRVGYYRVIRASFILKIFTGLSLFVIGRDYPWIIAVFFLVEWYVAAVPFFTTFKIFKLLPVHYELVSLYFLYDFIMKAALHV